MNAVFGGGTEIGSSDHLSLYSGGDKESAKVFVSSDGNVGIGTTSPGSKLHVGGKLT